MDADRGERGPRERGDAEGAHRGRRADGARRRAALRDPQEGRRPDQGRAARAGHTRAVKALEDAYKAKFGPSCARPSSGRSGRSSRWGRAFATAAVRGPDAALDRRVPERAGEKELGGGRRSTGSRRPRRARPGHRGEQRRRRARCGTSGTTPDTQGMMNESAERMRDAAEAWKDPGNKRAAATDPRRDEAGPGDADRRRRRLRGRERALRA